MKSPSAESTYAASNSLRSAITTRSDSQHYVHGLLNHRKTTVMVSSDLHEILKYASVDSLPQVSQIPAELAAGWTLDPSLLQSA